MSRAILIIVLLLVACFGLAARLDSIQSSAREQSGQAESFLALLLGEGRALFANEIFAKADAYFHRGSYPSIFETAQRREENHMLGETKEEVDIHAGHEHGEPGHVHTAECEHDHSDHAGEHHEGDGHDHGEHGHGKQDEAGKVDWIERFGRHFSVAEHVHLEKGNEREMLPWLKLTADLDPKNIEAYTVAAYWLRERLGKVDEAERFLREGLRRNPQHPELLNELARLTFESRLDSERARNLWLAALRRWYEVEQPLEEPNEALVRDIFGGLYRVELKQNDIPKAIDYLEQLKPHSPHPESVQEKIDQHRAQLTNAEP